MAGRELPNFVESVREALRTAGFEGKSKVIPEELARSISLRTRDEGQADKIQQDTKSTLEGSEKLTVENIPGSNQPDHFEEMVRKCLDILNIGSYDNLTAEDVVNFSESLAKGELLKPEVNQESMQKFEEASLRDKITKYPSETIEYIKFHILQTVWQRGTKWIKSLFPVSQLSTLILVFLLTNITQNLVLKVVPLFVFHICIFSMFIFSLQMFYGRTLSLKMDAIGSLLKTMDPLQDAPFMQNFDWNSKTPYIGYVISCIIAAIMLPLCDVRFIPSSLFCIVSFSFTVLTLRAHSTTLNQSELINDCVVGLLFLKRTLTFYGFGSNILTEYRTDSLRFVVNAGGLLEAALIYALVVNAIFARNKEKDARLNLLMSATISLLWFQMGLKMFSSSTWPGIFHVTVGWILVILAFPMLLIYIVLQLSYSAVTSWLTFSFSAKVVITILTITITTGGLIYTRFKNSNLWRILLAFIAVFLGIAVTLSLVTLSHYTAKDSKLPFNEYCRHCTAQGQSDYERIRLQMACDKYVDRSITWNGIVESSSATLTENSAMKIIGTFPFWLQRPLKCIFGKSDVTEFFDALISNKCYLSLYDKYSISLTVKSLCPAAEDSNGVVQKFALIGDETILNYLKYIESGTEISFNGTLVSGLGTNLIRINLMSISFKDDSLEFEAPKTLFQLFMSAGIESLSFFIGPVIFLKS